MAINIYNIIEQLAFNRPSASNEELKAASIIRNCIYEMGKSCEIVNYDIIDYEVVNTTLKSMDKEYDVVGIKGSGNANQISAPLYFMENSSDQDNFKLRGKIVLIEGSLDIEKYQKLLNCKAAAFITYDETITELDQKYISIGTIPGVKIKKDDARILIKDNPLFLTLDLEQRSTYRTGRNVISEIRGTTFPNEIMCITSSLDSYPNSIGAYDSGTGCAMLLKIFEHFTQNPPKRTIRFLWFGSEKNNNTGSKTYLENLEDVDLEKIIFSLTIDKCGLALGKTTINVYTEHALANYIAYESKIASYPIHVTSKHPYSSAIYFAKNNIPALLFSKLSTMKEKEVDSLQLISEETLESTALFLLNLLQKFINADTFPVKRIIPDEVKAILNKH